MKMTREFYVPKGAVPSVNSEAGTTVYLYDLGEGRPCATGFVGKRAKPAFNYRFSSPEKRAAFVDKWVASYLSIAKYKQKQAAERRADKQAAVESVKVGDIYYSSWGYDQTNVDFYKVIEKKKAMFTVVQIGKLVKSSSVGSDYVVADPDRIVGKPMNKFISVTGFRVSSHSSASPWDGTPKYETAFGYGH